MKLFKYLGVTVAAMMLVLGASTVASADTAPDGAEYLSENLGDGEITTGNASGEEGHDRELPLQAASLDCWDPYLSGSVFAISCSGNHFYVWADCSNGYRYAAGAFSGTYRVSIKCPGGSRALRGGAYGS